MSLSRRPRNQVEREECIEALGSHASAVGAHPVVAAMLVAGFGPVRETYETTLAELDEADAELSAARVRRNDAGVAFEVAFRLWCSTVRDPLGRSRVRQLSVQLGAAPAVFLRRKPRTRLGKMRRFLPLMARHPDLGGDPARLRALIRANAVFAGHLAVCERAFRERKALVEQFERATVAFDKEYTLLAAAIRRYDPDWPATLPAFVRKPRQPRKAAEAPEPSLPLPFPPRG